MSPMVVSEEPVAEQVYSFILQSSSLPSLMYQLSSHSATIVTEIVRDIQSLNSSQNNALCSLNKKAILLLLNLFSYRLRGHAPSFGMNMNGKFVEYIIK